MDYTTEELDALYKLLPEELTEVMYGDERDRVLRHLADRYKLTSNQKEALDIAVDDVILGISSYHDLPQSLVSYLDCSPSIAGNISQDLYDFLLSDARVGIGEMEKKRQEFDISISEKRKPQTTKEPDEPKTESKPPAEEEKSAPEPEKKTDPVPVPVRHIDPGGNERKAGKAPPIPLKDIKLEERSPVPGKTIADNVLKQDTSTIGKVRIVGNHFGLQMEQTAILVKDVDDVLNKTSDPRGFPERIAVRLNVPKETAQKISEELNSAIFLHKKLSVLPPKLDVNEERVKIVPLEEGSVQEGPWPKDIESFVNAKEKELDSLGERLRLEKVSKEYDDSHPKTTPLPSVAGTVPTEEKIVGATSFENRAEPLSPLSPSEELANKKPVVTPAKYNADPYREPIE